MKKKDWTFTARTAMKVIAVFLTLLASYYLIQGTLSLSDKDIYYITSAPFGGENPEFAISLMQQKLHTAIGFFLLLLAFLLQIIDLLIPIRIGDFTISPEGVVIGIIISIFIFLTCADINVEISEEFPKKVRQIYSDYKGI